jgi:hypothetical protein
MHKSITVNVVLRLVFYYKREVRPDFKANSLILVAERCGATVQELAFLAIVAWIEPFSFCLALEFVASSARGLRGQCIPYINHPCDLAANGFGLSPPLLCFVLSCILAPIR